MFRDYRVSSRNPSASCQITVSKVGPMSCELRCKVYGAWASGPVALFMRIHTVRLVEQSSGLITARICEHPPQDLNLETLNPKPHTLLPQAINRLALCASLLLERAPRSYGKAEGWFGEGFGVSV